MLKKTNEKKVLHKVKKRWVVLGTALFVFTAAGAYPETAHADTADNHSFTQTSTTSSAADQSKASESSNPASSTSTNDSNSSTIAGSTSSASAASVSGANSSSTSTTTQSSASASSSVTTSDSSNVDVQDDDLMYRDGDGTTGTTSPNSATNVSLVSSEQYPDNISTSMIGSSSGNNYSIGLSISGNPSAKYHEMLTTDNKYSVQFANSGSVSPITGISNVYQHIQLANGSEGTKSVSSDTYSFNSNISSSISVTYYHSSSIASNATQVTFSNGPYDSEYSNNYYIGDQVWWTFDIIPNSNFKSNGQTLFIDSSNKTITGNTPIEINFLDENGGSASNSQWVTGDNIYLNNTFSVETSAISGYHFNGSFSDDNGVAVSGHSGDATVQLSGKFSNWGTSSVNLGFSKDQITTYTASSTSYPSNLSQSDFQKVFTRNINFVDSATGQSIHSSASQTVTYDRTGQYDEDTKSIISYGDWTTSDSSFAAYPAPSISGYENPQPASVAASVVNSDDTTTTTSATIKYTKNSNAPTPAPIFSGNVTYFDVTTNSKLPISGETFDGNAGAVIQYSTQSVVDSLTSSGYSLTSDSPTPSATITINSSSNSYSFKFTHKTSTSNEAKTFTRNIDFINSATGQSIQSAAIQTVTFSRSATYDEVTKSTSYGNWTTSNSSFAAYPAPSINGYTNPQPASVAASVVNSNDAATITSATIKYTQSSTAPSPVTPTPAPTFSGNVTYFDVTTNSNLPVATESFSGNAGAVVNYNTQSVVNSLTNNGYSLTSDSPAPSTTITINSGNNKYVFKFVHKTSTSNEAKTFTRNINFVDSATNQPIQSSTSQTVTFSRSATYDEVTKSTSYGNWTTSNSSFATYDVPSISGYDNPQPASVAAVAVNSSDPQTIDVTVKYAKSIANVDANVKFIDVNNENHPVTLASASFNGSVGSVADYSTQSVVNSLTGDGYALISGNPSSSVTLNSGNNDYVFNFVHQVATYDGNSSSYPAGLVKWDFAKTFTRTINFVDATTNQPVQSAATQTITFNRSATYDEVTKATSYGDWNTNNDSFAAYNAPVVSGYNDPQPVSVAAASVDASTPQTTEVTVQYTKQSASVAPVKTVTANVTFIDVNDVNHPVTLANSSFNGPVGSVADYSTQGVVNSLTSNGYSLVSGTPASSISLTSGDNNYVFNFVHQIANYNGNSSSYPAGLVKWDFQKDFTRNINFVDAATGQPVQSSVSQTVTFSRSATYDEVTKATSYGSWTTDNSSFAAYAAPSVNGYVNPQPASVAASAVNSDGPQTTSANIEYTRSVASVTSASSSVSSANSNFVFASSVSYAPLPSSVNSNNSMSVNSSSNSSSNVATSSSATTSFASSTAPVVITSVATKMYNDVTQLVKSGNQILIYIEPRYANETGVAASTDSYVVNIQNNDGTVSHTQLVTLDQYNAMLVASGKNPYTPQTLQQAYVERSEDQGILYNDDTKTTFDAKTVQKGNDTFIFTDTNDTHHGFKRPKDGKLVLDKNKKNHKNSNKGKKNGFKNKKKHIKNQRQHAKVKHQNAKKKHLNHKK